MLQVSENAVAALENIRSSEGIPETFGVRVSGEQGAGGIVINLAFAETPEDADQVTEQAGTEIYVAPEVADPLESAVLDVQQSDSGLQLVFRSQEPEA